MQIKMESKQHKGKPFLFLTHLSQQLRICKPSLLFGFMHSVSVELSSLIRVTLKHPNKHQNRREEIMNPEKTIIYSRQLHPITAGPRLRHLEICEVGLLDFAEGGTFAADSHDVLSWR